MKLSVILPCYNGAETIAVQLDALVPQQWSEDCEVIVVNNGSTDHSVEIVEQYRDRLPNLRIVDAYTPPGPRLGVSHSYNTGLAAATGDAFVFCEADDQVSPHWLAGMAEALCHHDLVTGSLEYTRLNEPWIVAAHGGGAQSEGLLKVNHAPYLSFAYGCNFGMKRCVYEAVGAIDETFPCAWDMDYSFRAQLAGFPLHFAPEVLVHYRVRHSFKAIFRQSRKWGQDNPLIRKRYGVGMGKLELVRRTLEALTTLLQGVFVFRNRTELAKWLFSLGWQVGEIEGLFQHFIFSFFKERLDSIKAHKSAQRISFEP